MSEGDAAGTGRAAVDARVQSADFDPGRQLARLGELRKSAVASVVGRVEAGPEVEEVWIDHHAGLARTELLAIGEQALGRWPLAGAILIHRQGRLAPGDRVMFAAAAASSIEVAEEACSWMVAQVRMRAPFWRKDKLADGTARWFEPPARRLDANGAGEAGD